MPQSLLDNTRLFWLVLLGLVVLLLVVPLVGTRLLDLDGRTPQGIARDTLHDDYGLNLVDPEGKRLPADSVADTLSEFSVERGSTTEQVPFLRDGVRVTCTVAVPEGPDSITASCES